MERTLKIMIIHVEFVLNDEVPGKLWGDKGGPGPESGGTPWDPPKGRLEHGAGGECFAPLVTKVTGNTLGALPIA